MVDDGVFQTLMDVSFRFVSFRPRSKKEFVDALKAACKKRHIEDISVIDRVLARLIELGYVDDEKFAAWWVTQRNQFRPKGWRALSFELKQKGIILKKFDDTTEETNVIALATKVFGKFTALSSKEQKMKLYAYLARRGFDSDVISRVVDAMMNKGYNTDTTEST